MEQNSDINARIFATRGNTIYDFRAKTATECMLKIQVNDEIPYKRRIYSRTSSSEFHAVDFSYEACSAIARANLWR